MSTKKQTADEQIQSYKYGQHYIEGPRQVQDLLFKSIGQLGTESSSIDPVLGHFAKAFWELTWKEGIGYVRSLRSFEKVTEQVIGKDARGRSEVLVGKAELEDRVRSWVTNFLTDDATADLNENLLPIYQKGNDGNVSQMGLALAVVDKYHAEQTIAVVGYTKGEQMATLVNSFPEGVKLLKVITSGWEKDYRRLDSSHISGVGGVELYRYDASKWPQAAVPLVDKTTFIKTFGLLGHPDIEI